MHHQAPGRGVQDAASLLEPSSQIPGRDAGRIFEWPCFGQACYLPDVGRS